MLLRVIFLGLVVLNTPWLAYSQNEPNQASNNISSHDTVFIKNYLNHIQQAIVRSLDSVPQMCEEAEDYISLRLRGENLNSSDWVKKYIFWELQLLKLVGFDLELKNMVNEERLNNKKIYFVQSSTEKKIVPNFLVDHSEEKLDDKVLLNGLKLVGDYLDKTILKPNNINYPSTRLDFINLLK